MVRAEEHNASLRRQSGTTEAILRSPAYDLEENREKPSENPMGGSLSPLCCIKDPPAPVANRFSPLGFPIFQPVKDLDTTTKNLHHDSATTPSSSVIRLFVCKPTPLHHLTFTVKHDSFFRRLIPTIVQPKKRIKYALENNSTVAFNSSDYCDSRDPPQKKETSNHQASVHLTDSTTSKILSTEHLCFQNVIKLNQKDRMVEMKHFFQELFQRLLTEAEISKKASSDSINELANKSFCNNTNGLSHVLGNELGKKSGHTSSNELFNEPEKSQLHGTPHAKKKTFLSSNTNEDVLNENPPTLFDTGSSTGSSTTKSSTPPVRPSCIWSPIQFPEAPQKDILGSETNSVSHFSKETHDTPLPITPASNLSDIFKQLNSNQSEAFTSSTPTTLDKENSLTTTVQKQTRCQPNETEKPMNSAEEVSKAEVFHSHQKTTLPDSQGISPSKDTHPYDPCFSKHKKPREETFDSLLKLFPEEIYASLEHANHSITTLDSSLESTMVFLKKKDIRLNHISSPYMFDAKLFPGKEGKLEHHFKRGSRRMTAEYCCSYPGVSWNSRMQSWLVYFEDWFGRKSRTFNPKRLTQEQLNKLPLEIRQKVHSSPIEVSMHCACIFASRVRLEQRLRRYYNGSCTTLNRMFRNVCNTKKSFKCSTLNAMEKLVSDMPKDAHRFTEITEQYIQRKNVEESP